MLTFTINKETYLVSKVGHSKGKSDFLNKIIKDILSRRELFERIENTRIFNKIKRK